MSPGHRTGLYCYDLKLVGARAMSCAGTWAGSGTRADAGSCWAGAGAGASSVALAGGVAALATIAVRS